MVIGFETPEQLEEALARPLPRRLVLIESPYKGDVEYNKAYARRAMKDCIARGEAPLVGHLLYTQVLDDDNPDARALGIACHLALHQAKIWCVVYADLGISDGMSEGIKMAKASGTPVEYRTIGRNPTDAPH